MLAADIRFLDLTPICEPTVLKAQGGVLVQSPASFFTLTAGVAYQAEADATGPEHVRLTSDGVAVTEVTSKLFSVVDQVRETRLTLYDFRQNCGQFFAACENGAADAGLRWFVNTSSGSATNSTYVGWRPNETTRYFTDRDNNHFLHSMGEKPATLYLRVFPNKQDGTSWAFWSWGDPNNFMPPVAINNGGSVAAVDDMRWRILTTTNAANNDYIGFTRAEVQHFR